MSVEPAAITDSAKLGQVVLASLLAGVGVSAIVALGVSSAAGLLEALRARRIPAAVGWGAVAALCAATTLGVIATGLVVMSTK